MRCRWMIRVNLDKPSIGVLSEFRAAGTEMGACQQEHSPLGSFVRTQHGPQIRNCIVKGPVGIPEGGPSQQRITVCRAIQKNFIDNTSGFFEFFLGYLNDRDSITRCESIRAGWRSRGNIEINDERIIVRLCEFKQTSQC